jgi:hypothetical protein
LKLSIWPGLALAGGVVIAAVITLLLISGGGGAPEGRLPSGSNPADTRLFPSDGAAAGKHHKAAPRPAKRRTRGVVTVPGGSAAEFQYGVNGNRGLVLGGP